MHYAIIPGCLILQRMQAYEESARALFSALEIPVENLTGWVCCGSNVGESFRDDWFVLSAYNLALAAQSNVALITLCGGCTITLRRARHLLQVDKQAHALAQERLARVGLSLEYLPGIQHILQVLDEHRSQIAKQVTNRLGIRVAVTNPCQVFRPAEIAKFDNPVRPQVMRRLAELAGAEVITYDDEYTCCGSAALMTDRNIALELGRNKHLSAREADVIVDACGNCHMLLERHAAAIAQGDRSLCKPLLFIPQLLGLALDLTPESLAISERQFMRVFGTEFVEKGVT